MQILTKLLIVSAIAAIISPLSSRAADTDAQIKAREALRQKMSELQPMETSAAPPSAISSKAAKSKPAPAPVATQPTPAPAPAPTVKTIPPPVQTPASATEMTRPMPTSPPPQTVNTTPPPKKKPIAKSSTPSGQVTASRPDSERIAKARLAMEEKLKELQEQPGQESSTHPPAVASMPAPAPATSTAAVSRPAPVASSSAPVSHAPEISSTAAQPGANPEPAVSNEPLP